MDKKQQRNTIIIVIILLLLFFMFNKKDQRETQENGNGNDDNGNGNDVLGCTDPDDINYNDLATIDDGSCIGSGITFPVACSGYDCSNFNFQTSCSGCASCTPTTIAPTPLPIVEASNTNYLVGSDPILKGDYKLYYICCPLPITNNGNGAGCKLPNKWSVYDYNNLNNKKWAILLWQPYQDCIFYGGTCTYVKETDGSTTTITHNAMNTIAGVTYNNPIDFIGYNEAGISQEIYQRSQSWMTYTTMMNRVRAYNNYMGIENPSLTLDGTNLYGDPCGSWGSSYGGHISSNCAITNAGIFIGTYADGSTRLLKASPFGIAFPLTSAYDPYTQTGNSPLVSISATFNYQPYWINTADPQYSNIQTYTKIFNIS